MDSDKSNELKEKAYKLGYENEQKYYGCGQCVVAALQDALGKRDDAVFKAASGFAGGIGLAGDSACGGYAGAVMVMSTIMGRERDNFEDPEMIRFKSFELAKRLHDKFVQELGSVNCHALHSRLYGRPYWLWDNDDREKFDNMGGHSDQCPHVCGLASKWAIELLEEEGLI